jgi:CheY-like chemotaxis protein
MNPVNMKSAKEADMILRKRILLVDDEPIVRESIGMLLSLDEHTVVEATNGDEALCLFTRGQFDLVVTDFQIPSMTGSELAARIKQLAPSQPILMITGHAERPGPASPIDVVLDKPFDLSQLRSAIEIVLSDVEECSTA